MNTPLSKKVAAAIAAVLQHAAEAEALAAPAAAAPGPTPTAPPAVWGLAGRQDAMLYRHLWQRRLSKSW